MQATNENHKVIWKVIQLNGNNSNDLETLESLLNDDWEIWRADCIHVSYTGNIQEFVKGDIVYVLYKEIEK